MSTPSSDPRAARARRVPAVAGLFYPDDPAVLGRELERLWGDPASSTATDTDAESRGAKVLVVPHAGYRYSGALAARAYRALGERAARVRRVVLLGPAHRVWVPGLALPAADAFTTPLGDVPIDAELRRQVAGLPGVETSDAAHAQEHSLEVQLPMLQHLLGDFRLLPLVVGGADAETVARVLDAVWGDDETLIVISTDLSHFHDDTTARRLDARTAVAIEALRGGLSGNDACGAGPLNGLLRCAARRGLHIRRIGLCNSADAGAPPDRVVGYGAWLLEEDAA